jgi:Tfp pilus assembly protein PilX
MIRQREQGAVLVVGLVMLVLITIVLVGAYVYSSSNSRAVGNQQFRAEGLAAANQAIERVISSPFTDAPVAQELLVDINSDGTNDYRVNVDAPTCVTSTPLSTAASAPSSVTLGGNFQASVGAFTLTEWNLHATARDMGAGSGATVEVNQGVRVQLSQAQANAVCP